MPEEGEFDETDHYALHCLLYVEERPVGTGRIYHDGHTNRIGRIAILKEYRKKGLGDLLTRLLLFKTFQHGAKQIVIHAQTYIAGMYEKFGFVAEGEEFLEESIPHVKLRLKKEDFVLPSQCCH